MDDLSKRLGSTAASVAELRSEVAGISAMIPHLATKADLKATETAIIKSIIATVLTTAWVAFAIARFVH